MTAVTPSARPDARAWAVLAALCFVYVLNFLDRQLLSILSKPIQDDLGVSDGQLGLIGGLYFALFYCLLAIPVGWLADRSNRVKVLSLACALWSAATIACGLASNYPQLAAARMSVGVGEAGGVPPSYAIISDYFPPGTRGTALGLFNLGPPIGQALGVAFGASIAAAYSWRLAFISLGVVGIVTALGVWLFVREPQRGGLDAVVAPAMGAAPTDVSPSGAPFWASCRRFFADPVLLRLSLACGAVATIVLGLVFGPVLAGGSLALVFATLAAGLLVMGFVYGPLGGWMPALMATPTTSAYQMATSPSVMPFSRMRNRVVKLSEP